MKKKLSRSTGKIALITGGSQGIGQQVSNVLSSRGILTIAAARSLKTKRLSPYLYTHFIDLTSPPSITRLFTWIEKEFGQLNYLVNSAGVGTFGPFEKFSQEELDLVIDTNFKGAFLCTQKAIPLLLAAEGGRVLNIGSIANEIALPGNALYGASKWALKGLSLICSEEFKGKKLRFTHLSLGAVSTAIWKGRKGFRREDMLEPEWVAEQIADLLCLPLNARVDEMILTPPKGVL